MPIKKITFKKLNKYKKKSKFIKKLKGGGVIDLSNINQIEGPIYVSILEPTPLLNTTFKTIAPTILLLGDIHIGSDKCKKDCEPSKGCYSLYENEINDVKNFSLLKYLDNEAGKSNKKIDLFIEAWLGSDKITNPMTFNKKKNDNIKNTKDWEHNSALGNMLKLVYVCHTQRKEYNQCPFKNIRIHMSDPRSISNKDENEMFGGTLLKIWDDIITKYRNIEFFKDNNDKEDANFYYDYNSFFQNYKTDILKKCSNIYPILNEYKEEITPIYLFDLIKRIYKGYNINDFIKEPFYMKTNKALKQYYKLLEQNPNVAKEIIINANKIYKSECKYDSLCNTADDKDFIIKYTKIPYIDNGEIMLHIAMFQVDLHTICRLLKKPAKKNSMNNNSISSLSIVYLGDEHIDNIEKLLEGIYTKTYDKTSLDIDIKDEEKLNKYIDDIMSGDVINENIKCINTNIPSILNTDSKKKSICNLLSKL